MSTLRARMGLEPWLGAPWGGLSGCFSMIWTQSGEVSARGPLKPHQPSSPASCLTVFLAVSSFCSQCLSFPEG